MAKISAKHEFIARRRVARKLSLMAAYQWQLNGDDFHDIYTYYQQDDAMAADLRKADVSYFKALVDYIIEYENELLEVFTDYLDLPIAQVGPIERCVLLLGTTELKNHPEVDYKTSVNEWVNLAKKFGPEQSFRFINGVLDKVAHQLRSDEISKK
jgi:N utilization substance protein B